MSFSNATSSAETVAKKTKATKLPSVQESKKNNQSKPEQRE